MGPGPCRRPSPDSPEAQLRLPEPPSLRRLGSCRSLWRPHDSDCPTRPGAGNATRHRIRRGMGVPNSSASSASLAPKTRRRRSAGEVVLGVDTHRDAHVAAVLFVMGAVLATHEFPANAAGYRDLLTLARKLGTVGRAGVEGAGSFGASLSRYLLAQGVDVFDVNRMDPADRRRRGTFRSARNDGDLRSRLRTHPAPECPRGPLPLESAPQGHRPERTIISKGKRAVLASRSTTICTYGIAGTGCCRGEQC